MRVPVIGSTTPSLAPLVEAAIQTWPSELERADMRAQTQPAECLQGHPLRGGIELRFHTDRNPDGYRLAWVRRSLVPEPTAETRLADAS